MRVTIIQTAGLPTLWSVRELVRQINSLLYERVGLSRDKEGVLAIAREGELEKSEARVEYALGGLSNSVFVSRYLLHLPTKEELEAFLQQTRSELKG